MIILCLRSSMLGTHSWCQFQWYIGSVLGWKTEVNQKAVQGTIVHKALELLARKKLAEQQGIATFQDDELAIPLGHDLTPDHALDLAWDYYVEHDKREWTDRQKKSCREWMWVALTFNDGMFSPLKRTIVQPEQYFDIPLNHDWAHYDYRLPDGRTWTGQLALRGTLDLLTEIEPGTLEYIDWKTGAYRTDWATGEYKSIDKLYDDQQLLLYFYALAHLYPKVKEVFMTIFYLQAGGPESLCLSGRDIPRIEKMLREKFTQMKNTRLPGMTVDWRCSRFCPFGRKEWIDQEWTTPEEEYSAGESVCQHMRVELLQLGMPAQIAKHLKSESLTAYSGGGRTEKKDE